MSIGPGRVTVSLTSLAAVPMPQGQVAPAWLGEQELDFYRGITAPRRQAEFIAGRRWARQSLAQAAGGPWQEYVLSAPDGVAPEVLHAPAAGPSRELHFSLSHSGHWLACAVASHPVGVDIEDMARQRDTDALGDWIYGADERAIVLAMPVQPRRERFFALWTLKEAWFKQAPVPAAMHTVQFKPCDAEQAQGVVLRNPQFTLAVVPASPEQLDLRGAGLAGLPPECWRFVTAG